MTIYVCYEQSGYFTWTTVKAFKNEQKAKDYCAAQNLINKPEFDDYGWIPEGGVDTGYYPLEVEE